MVSSIHHLMWISFYHFIAIISQISTKSLYYSNSTDFLINLITLQRVSWQNNSLTTVVEVVSSDVLELRVPPKGISQQMSPFGQLQPCVNFALDVSFPAIYDRMRIPHIGNV